MTDRTGTMARGGAPTRLTGSSAAAHEPPSGYVDVRQEPQHHNRFENDYVRVYDVRFGPGEASLYHRHHIDTMYVTVYDTRVWDHRLGADEAQVHDLPAGLSLCRPHGADPLIHQVRNEGTGLMHMIGAEVKSLPGLVSPRPFEGPFHKQLANPSGAARLRLYEIRLEPGDTTGTLHYDFSGLTVSLSDANVEYGDGNGTRRVISFSPGSHMWHDGPLTQTLTNVGDTAFVAIMGEWC